MKEKYVRLSDLVPYEKNPRKNAKAVGPTARSMEDLAKLLQAGGGI